MSELQNEAVPRSALLRREQPGHFLGAWAITVTLVIFVVLEGYSEKEDSLRNHHCPLPSNDDPVIPLQLPNCSRIQYCAECYGYNWMRATLSIFNIIAWFVVFITSKLAGRNPDWSKRHGYNISFCYFLVFVAANMMDFMENARQLYSLFTMIEACVAIGTIYFIHCIPAAVDIGEPKRKLLAVALGVIFGSNLAWAGAWVVLRWHLPQGAELLTAFNAGIFDFRLFAMFEAFTMFLYWLPERKLIDNATAQQKAIHVSSIISGLMLGFMVPGLYIVFALGSSSIFDLKNASQYMFMGLALFSCIIFLLFIGTFGMGAKRDHFDITYLPIVGITGILNFGAYLQLARHTDIPTNPVLFITYVACALDVALQVMIAYRAVFRRPKGETARDSFVGAFVIFFGFAYNAGWLAYYVSNIQYDLNNLDGIPGCGLLEMIFAACILVFRSHFLEIYVRFFQEFKTWVPADPEGTPLLGNQAV